MSMTTSPFGAPVATAAPAAPQQVIAEEPQSSKHTVIILAVVAAALAIGAGAYFLLFSGSDAAVVTRAPVPPRAPTATAPAPAAVPAPPIKKYVAKKTRNPFVALVVPAVAAAAGTTGGTTTSGTTTSGTTTSGTTSGTTTGTTTGTVTGTVPLPAPSPTQPTTSTKPVAVSVLAVDYVKGTASIKVNNTTHKPKIGETFAQYFKLVGVTKGVCAYVQYGDVALPMCVGEPLKLQ